MIQDLEDENETFDSAYTAKMKREMIPDGGRVHVPFYLMDSEQRQVAGRYALNDARSDGVRLRDEAHALMVDRMRNPKNYDINGRRLNDDASERPRRAWPVRTFRNRAEGVRLRDQAYAEMLDRLHNPKKYNQAWRA